MADKVIPDLNYQITNKKSEMKKKQWSKDFKSAKRNNSYLKRKNLFLQLYLQKTFKWLRGCLYGSRYIGQRVYRLTDITFSMHLYERTKVIFRFSWDFIWALF